MSRKKYLTLLPGIILLLGMIVVFNLFAPRPIVEDVSGSRIIRIQYNPYFKQDMDERIDITDYDEDGILNCLGRYLEYRTLNTLVGYCISNVELEVIIYTEDGFKSVLLGTDNYSYESNGKPKYKIRDADNLKAELLDMMAIYRDPPAKP